MGPNVPWYQPPAGRRNNARIAGMESLHISEGDLAGDDFGRCAQPARGPAFGAPFSQGFVHEAFAESELGAASLNHWAHS